MVVAQSQNIPGGTEGHDIRSYSKRPIYMLKFKLGTLQIKIVSATHGLLLLLET